MYAPPPAEEFSDSEDEFSFNAPRLDNDNGANYTVTESTNHNNIHAGTLGNTSSRSPWGPQSYSRPSNDVSSSLLSSEEVEEFRLAIIKGSSESVKNCIDKGLDVNIQFKTGWTPLMYSTHQVNIPVTTILLEQGADPNTTPTSALMSCCSSNVKNREADVGSCVSLLIKYGAQVDVADQYAFTPLMIASRKGHTAAVKVLLENKAKVNKIEKRGFTALSWACSSGHLPCIKMLIEYGADLNIATVDGQTPVRLAETSESYPQILAYFQTLPSFKPSDDKMIDDSWRSENSNGFATDSNSVSQTTSTTKMPDPITASSTQSQNNKFDDVELFLYGLQLPSLIPMFAKHNVAMDHLLNITDEDLIKIGVCSVGHRRLILNSVHELHKKEWNPSSIPAYEKVKSSKKLSCGELTAILANLANHSSCMAASTKYIIAQVSSNPGLLQVDKNGQGIHALQLFLHELKTNSQLQSEQCSELKQIIDQMLANGQAETVGHITQKSTEKTVSKMVTYSQRLAALSLLSFGVYIIVKRVIKVR